MRNESISRMAEYWIVYSFFVGEELSEFAPKPAAKVIEPSPDPSPV
jgi:hypothetical protein